AGRPGKLGVIDSVAVAVDDGLIEPERVDEELDEPTSVVRPERRPDLWCRWLMTGCVVCHASKPSSGTCPAAWKFRNARASQVVGADPASALNSRSMCAWS